MEEIHLTVADLKRAMETPAYSPNVYVELRDKESHELIGLYPAARVTPVRKDEPGEFFGAMVITAYATAQKEGQSLYQEGQPGARPPQEPKSSGGLLQCIRDLRR